MTTPSPISPCRRPGRPMPVCQYRRRVDEHQPHRRPHPHALRAAERRRMAAGARIAGCRPVVAAGPRGALPPSRGRVHPRAVVRGAERRRAESAARHLQRARAAGAAEGKAPAAAPLEAAGIFIRAAAVVCTSRRPAECPECHSSDVSKERRHSYSCFQCGCRFGGYRIGKLRISL